MITTTTNKFRYIALLVIIALVLPRFHYSQSYYFDNYSVKDGLLQSKVYKVIQDVKGNIWLGTPSGVSVFDGKNFENYTTEDSLSRGGVKSIYEDSNGNIWLGHLDGGLTRYGNKKFKTIVLPFQLSADITSILEDDNHNLWLTTVGSGAILLKKTTKNQLYKNDVIVYKGKNLSDRVYASYIDHNKVIYFITDVGIKYLNYTDTSFVNLKLEGLPAMFQIICMIVDKKGDFLFGTYHDGIYKYRMKEKKIEYINDKHGLTNNWVTCLAEDETGNIWAGTWGGGISKIGQGVIKSFNSTNGLNDDNIMSITIDYEGNILIGTWEHGLNIFKGEYFISYSENNGLIDNQISAINQDSEGNYWFGTSSGISIYNASIDSFINIHPEDNYLNSHKIRFIKKDKQNNLWIGTEDNGVLTYSTNNAMFVPVHEINKWNRLNRITALDIDNFNNVWVGTVDGLIYYEINSGYSERYSQVNGLSGNSISAVYCSNNNIIWVGCEGKGISTINLIDSSINTIESLNTISPKSFVEDTEGKLWIATELGIYVYYNNNIIQHYNENNGLLTNYTTFINCDISNNIYIGTNIGLNKINQKENKIYSYTKKNGFTGIEAKQNASYKDRNGDMWFGTTNGIMKYSTQLSGKQSVFPKTHIKSFRVNLQENVLKPNIKLNYNENSIYFEYISICATDPEAVRYQVMLYGIDEEWQPITQQTYVNYPALPHGNYIFKVKAKNHLGIWNKNPVEFPFTIKPPFYKTGWFIILIILTGIASIVLYIKIRERNLIKEKKILEDKVEERTLEISKKSIELVRKNRDITDSIKYAKRLQDAILPFDENPDNIFVLFKPKDIVSGDFFWITKKENKEIIAAVDCTGHGVPGAFVSFVGHNLLNKIVKEQNIIKPSEILSHLNIEVTKTFNPKGEGIVNDGMDMALICFDESKMELEYSGAFNPLYLYRNNEFTEIKGDRFAIGRSQRNINKTFTNHKIKIKKGDTIYLLSDGYADQFGGPKNRKFMTNKLKTLLKEIQPLKMAEQKDKLNKTLINWKGSIEQIDDILIIGRRF